MLLVAEEFTLHAYVNRVVQSTTDATTTAVLSSAQVDCCSRRRPALLLGQQRLLDSECIGYSTREYSGPPHSRSALGEVTDKVQVLRR